MLRKEVRGEISAVVPPVTSPHDIYHSGVREREREQYERRHRAAVCLPKKDESKIDEQHRVQSHGKLHAGGATGGPALRADILKSRSELEQI